MPVMPNIPCTITRTTDEPDIHGQTAEGVATSAVCGIVKLDTTREKTSIRADSSASRGNAAEIVAAARLLFLPGVEIAIGDFLTILGVSLRVIDVRFRTDIFGALDHYQVDADIWA